MVIANSKSWYGAVRAGGGDENIEKQTNLARQMVEDLEQFLRTALANEVYQQGKYRWPMRYNPLGDGNIEPRLNEE
ncbi:MAG TPA: hypothetical protein VGG19_10385 [Tepidisphaeraceae bacterium]|jgi:hypothetical protein